MLYYLILGSFTLLSLYIFWRIIQVVFYPLSNATRTLLQEISMREKLIGQLKNLQAQAQQPTSLVAKGIVGTNNTEYSFDLTMGRRDELIQQLRYAIGIAENPDAEFAEFELLDEGFCFEAEVGVAHE